MVKHPRALSNVNNHTHNLPKPTLEMIYSHSYILDFSIRTCSFHDLRTLVVYSHSNLI